MKLDLEFIETTLARAVTALETLRAGAEWRFGHDRHLDHLRGVWERVHRAVEKDRRSEDSWVAAAQDLRDVIGRVQPRLGLGNGMLLQNALNVIWELLDKREAEEQFLPADRMLFYLHEQLEAMQQECEEGHVELVAPIRDEARRWLVHHGLIEQDDDETTALPLRCGKCGRVVQLAVINRLATMPPDGWEFNTDDGWRCPECVGERA